jgi:glucosamine--fructose-6-phosphate aminotransferase (isomerizing)
LKLPILVDKTLGLEPILEQIAHAHQEFHFFFFMGRDLQYPIALEGALKLKEISYAHTEGYASGELKHGPIALVDRHTAVVVLAPTDLPAQTLPQQFNEVSTTLLEKSMSNLQEIKSRGGKLLTICTEGDSHFTRESDRVVYVPAAPWALNPILTSIPLQLFAYYMALEKGTDVDKPRNLAKSVTVE